MVYESRIQDGKVWGVQGFRVQNLNPISRSWTEVFGFAGFWLACRMELDGLGLRVWGCKG